MYLNENLIFTWNIELSCTSSFIKLHLFNNYDLEKSTLNEFSFTFFLHLRFLFIWYCIHFAFYPQKHIDLSDTFHVILIRNICNSFILFVLSIFVRQTHQYEIKQMSFLKTSLLFYLSLAYPITVVLSWELVNAWRWNNLQVFCDFLFHNNLSNKNF